ncbi:MAG: general secretion pathway protein GspB [Desulfobacterales bacterium]|nr:general secretion pathway protein GspB [Desulfobacterales bacterium]
MKRKYYSIYVLLFVLITLPAIPVMFSEGLSDHSRYRQSTARMEPLISIPAPGQGTIKEMARLERVMPQLVEPAGIDETSAQMGLFGYYPSDGGASGTTGKQSIGSRSMDYSLSFAFWSGEKRFCVLDGEFYAEGATLPDGAEILKIRPNRVLLTKKGVLGWIPLDQFPGAINNKQESGEKP